jgi:deoxyribodipyrimidine photolyase
VEHRVRNAIKSMGGNLKLIWGATLFHKDDLPFRPELDNMPDVFTPFKDACEKKSRGVRLCAPTPSSLPALPANLADKAKEAVPPLTVLGYSAEETASAATADPRSVLAFKGGEVLSELSSCTMIRVASERGSTRRVASDQEPNNKRVRADTKLRTNAHHKEKAHTHTTDISTIHCHCQFQYQHSYEWQHYHQIPNQHRHQHQHQPLCRYPCECRISSQTAALARLKHYLWDADRLRIYFETRNGMIGADYSSKFSAWLAHG